MEQVKNFKKMSFKQNKIIKNIVKALEAFKVKNK